MTITSKSVVPRARYHQDAYQFVFAALRYTQQSLERLDVSGDDSEEEDKHITGPELLEGLRGLACEQFGLMTLVVFRRWGLNSTQDVGRIVFEFIEDGKMKKTDRDLLSDFFELYDFEDVFDQNYEIDTSRAFRN